MTITGECFCGSIRYQINGELSEGRSCHCSRCRKLTGAQASAYAEVTPGTFEWTAGKELLTTYESGEGFGHQYCSRCGSTLCGIYEGRVHGVMLGCVNGDPGVEIGMHIYIGSKAPRSFGVENPGESEWRESPERQPSRGRWFSDCGDLAAA